jgi:hypothetical protein
MSAGNIEHHTATFKSIRPHYLIVMPEIAHPNGDGRIDVEIIDTETHSGDEFAQVQATDDGTDLSDQSSEAPWVGMDEVMDE